VRGDDHARLGDDADALTVFHGNEAYMRMHDGHCSALRIAQGADAFSCSVYETRPDTCRDLERGSPECAGEIATNGERPRHYLARNVTAT
jgi:Fe-S-cluster containining protein